MGGEQGEGPRKALIGMSEIASNVTQGDLLKIIGIALREVSCVIVIQIWTRTLPYDHE